MLAILSPAKSLDESPVSSGLPRTDHAFGADTTQLLKSVKRLRPAQLKALMGISDKLAELNHERHQSLEIPVEPEALAAAHLFDGDVYKGLDARSLSDDDLAWAQGHVAILSGLYGLLRPLDRTHPYRLEMGTRLKTRRGADLYAFWGDRIARHLDKALEGHADPVVVDLASREYSKVIDRKVLKAPWLSVEFKEVRDGDARIISFFAKRARGLMARYLVEHRIERREDLKGFDAEGYAFDPERSSDASWVFTRSSS
ncbi:MAG: peroxide stress protein YaaA [Myxococcota bacterium]